MLPFTYDALADRYATVRPWAKSAVGDTFNRCAICMGYTMRITPSGDDVTIEAIMNDELGTSFRGARALPGGPQSGVPRGSREPLRGLRKLEGSKNLALLTISW